MYRFTGMKYIIFYKNNEQQFLFKTQTPLPKTKREKVRPGPFVHKAIFSDNLGFELGREAGKKKVKSHLLEYF